MCGPSFRHTKLSRLSVFLLWNYLLIARTLARNLVCPPGSFKMESFELYERGGGPAEGTVSTVRFESERDAHWNVIPLVLYTWELCIEEMPGLDGGAPDKCKSASGSETGPGAPGPGAVATGPATNTVPSKKLSRENGGYRCPAFMPPESEGSEIQVKMEVFAINDETVATGEIPLSVVNGRVECSTITPCYFARRVKPHVKFDLRDLALKFSTVGVENQELVVRGYATVAEDSLGVHCRNDVLPNVYPISLVAPVATKNQELRPEILLLPESAGWVILDEYITLTPTLQCSKTPLETSGGNSPYGAPVRVRIYSPADVVPPQGSNASTEIEIMAVWERSAKPPEKPEPQMHGAAARISPLFSTAITIALFTAAAAAAALS